MNKFALLTVRGKHAIYMVCDTLEQARTALKDYNANRDAIKRRNTDKQVAWSRGYNAARDKWERNKWLANKPKRERVPAEMFISSVVC